MSDSENDQHVDEYCKNDLEYMLKKEKECRNKTNAKYMSAQNHLSHELRTKLFDWLMGVCDFYSLPPEVWFLSLNYFDRFLSRVVVKENDVQLLGMTCLYIAWKIDNNSSVCEMKEMVKLSYGIYNVKEMLEMETIVLKILNFDLCPPTANYFCDKFLNETQADDNIRYQSMMLMEMMVMNGEYSLQFLPSEIASSSIFVARLIHHKPPWNEKLSKVTGYECKSLIFCIVEVHNIFFFQPLQYYEHIREKYSSRRFNRVAHTKILPLSSYIYQCPHLKLQSRSSPGEDTPAQLAALLKAMRG